MLKNSNGIEIITLFTISHYEDYQMQESEMDSPPSSHLREIISETYEKFPDYLFAQTALAHIYLEEGLPEKTMEVLKGAYTLKQLYPQRDVFHISEFKVFNSCMIRYFCKIQDFKRAEVYLQMLQEVLEPDDILLQSAQKRFKMERSLYYFGARMKRLLKSDKK